MWDKFKVFCKNILHSLGEYAPAFYAYLAVDSFQASGFWNHFAGFYFLAAAIRNFKRFLNEEE
ncbi:MAG TPA: hypothetical protein VHD33_03980 [Legionellaceae bacterium]|nr:hypothetical protein [Legionellaceae bacterium]